MIQISWLLPTSGSGSNWSSIPSAYDNNFSTAAVWNNVPETADSVRWYIQRDEDACVYVDKGAGYFGSNWVHKVDVRIKESSSGNSHGDIALLADSIDDAYGLLTGGNTYVGVKVGSQAPLYYIQLEEAYGSTLYSAQWTGMVLNTWYYLTITKAGTSLSCAIYSDAARTSLVTTLNLTLQADHSFRYVFAVDTWNNTLASAPYIDLYVGNLDLGSGSEDFLTYTKIDPNSRITLFGGYSPPLVLTLSHPIVCTAFCAVAASSVYSGIACINFELYYDGAWQTMTRAGFPAKYDTGVEGGGIGVGWGGAGPPYVFGLSSKKVENCRWTLGYPGGESSDSFVRETWFRQHDNCLVSTKSGHSPGMVRV